MKIALAFSGGKDSWACLWLNQHRLQDIEVLWVNTGKNYPELLETINLARSICPHFTEIKSDREGQNQAHGLPSDVVPINWTRLGQELTTVKPVAIQSYLQCCYENIGSQLQSYCKENGVTHLIRGQRNDESHKSPARDGSVVDGVVYLQPIENWSTANVMQFISARMAIPAHFSLGHTSMDCFDCTAFRRQSKDRIAYMKTNHPALYQGYKLRSDALNAAIIESLEIA